MGYACAILRLCPGATNPRHVEVIARCATALRFHPRGLVGERKGAEMPQIAVLRCSLYWLASQTGEMTHRQIAAVCGVDEREVVQGVASVTDLVLNRHRDGRAAADGWRRMELARLSFAPVPSPVAWARREAVA
jgi:hypothetical protein